MDAEASKEIFRHAISHCFGNTKFQNALQCQCERLEKFMRHFTFVEVQFETALMAQMKEYPTPQNSQKIWCEKNSDVFWMTHKLEKIEIVRNKNLNA